MRPLRKLSVWDVIKGMRDTYSGTPLEPYMSQNPHAPARPIALLRTQLTHVTQQRPQEAGLPEELTYIGVCWLLSSPASVRVDCGRWVGGGCSSAPRRRDCLRSSPTSVGAGC